MLAQRIDKITRSWEMQGWQKGQKKGLAKGRKEGREKGRREEAARLFLELFATKHGAVPEDVHRRVAAAETAELESWAKRLITAESPANVFED